jgi:hypothetical protein
MLGVGFAAEHKLSHMLKREGFYGMRKCELVALLEYCCDPMLPVAKVQESQVVTGLGYLDRLQEEASSEVYWSRKRIFSVLRQIRRSTASTSLPAHAAVDYHAKIMATVSKEEGIAVVSEALIEKLSRLLSIPKMDIDMEKPIYEAGIDSLIALEIRYWILKDLKADVPISVIMADGSLWSLAGEILKRSNIKKE